MTALEARAAWSSFYARGGGDVAGEIARQLAAGVAPKVSQLAREHALEAHLWGEPFPPCAGSGFNRLDVRRARGHSEKHISRRTA